MKPDIPADKSTSEDMTLTVNIIENINSQSSHEDINKHTKTIESHIENQETKDNEKEEEHHMDSSDSQSTVFSLCLRSAPTAATIQNVHKRISDDSSPNLISDDLKKLAGEEDMEDETKKDDVHSDDETVLDTSEDYPPQIETVSHGNLPDLDIPQTLNAESESTYESDTSEAPSQSLLKPALHVSCPPSQRIQTAKGLSDKQSNCDSSTSRCAERNSYQNHLNMENCSQNRLSRSERRPSQSSDILKVSDDTYSQSSSRSSGSKGVNDLGYLVNERHEREMAALNRIEKKLTRIGSNSQDLDSNLIVIQKELDSVSQVMKQLGQAHIQERERVSKELNHALQDEERKSKYKKQIHLICERQRKLGQCYRLHTEATRKCNEVKQSPQKQKVPQSIQKRPLTINAPIACIKDNELEIVRKKKKETPLDFSKINQGMSETRVSFQEQSGCRQIQELTVTGTVPSVSQTIPFIPAIPCDSQKSAISRGMFTPGHITTVCDSVFPANTSSQKVPSVPVNGTTGESSGSASAIMVTGSVSASSAPLQAAPLKAVPVRLSTGEAGVATINISSTNISTSQKNANLVVPKTIVTSNVFPRTAFASNVVPRTAFASNVVPRTAFTADKGCNISGFISHHVMVSEGHANSTLSTEAPPMTVTLTPSATETLTSAVCASVGKSTVATFPSLKELIEAGVITPGKDSLSMTNLNKVFVSSLLPSGLIQGAGGETFKTPTQWCSAVLPMPVRKSTAYQRVFYKNKPLSSYKTPLQVIVQDPEVKGSAQQQGAMSTNYPEKVSPSPSPPVSVAPLSAQITNSSNIEGKVQAKTSLQRLLADCKIHLISTDELFPSKSHLPADFWTADRFTDVVLSQECIDEIDRW